jgi:transcription elongation factor Elf1
MAKIKTIKLPITENLTKIKQSCTKCGSDKVEQPIMRKNKNTGKVINTWVCWNCEVNYDTVKDLNTKEGIYYEG